MASNAPYSPFLALPLELRRKIYYKLLSPNPDHVYPLYHDRYGQNAFSGRQTFEELSWARVRGPEPNLEPKMASNRSIPIDPRILQVNRQIYAEALPFLYEYNIYMIHLATPVVRQCTGGYYPDCCADPPSLFRADAYNRSERPDGAHTRADESLISSIETYGASISGIIYPHCFQSLRHIHLVIAESAIWESSVGGDYFSHTGEALWNVLKVMAENTQNVKTHLRVIMGADLWSGGRWGEKKADGKLRLVFGMMMAAQRRVDLKIEVRDGESVKPLRAEIPMREDEIDFWEEALFQNTADDMDDSAFLGARLWQSSYDNIFS